MDKQEFILSDDPFNDLKRYFEARRLFDDFLTRMKSGAVHNDGTDELLAIIDKYVFQNKDNPFFITIPKRKKLYRARVVNPDDLNLKKGFGYNERDLLGFNETESREPPLGLSCPGRNNIKGSSYLYLSNKITTACAEVKPGIRRIISLAEFETVETIKIIDFASKKHLDKNVEKINLNRLFTEIMGLYSLPVIKDEEYYATQYLSDYIRKTGVDGISYSSYFDDKGINYTIFNSDHRKIKYCGSKLMLSQCESKYFLDLNTNKVVHSISCGGKTADVNTTVRIRNNVIKAISENSKE